MLKHGKFRFPRWNCSYRASKSRRNTDMWGWKHVKMNWYVPGPTFTFAASACLYCCLYLTNTVDATVTVCLTLQKNQNPETFLTTQVACYPKRLSPRNFKAWDPWATNNKILVRTLLYISRFVWMSFCKGYSSRFSTSPSQFSLFEFLYMISLAGNHWLFMYWMIVKCCLTNTSFVCYLNLFKESFPYNSG